MASRGRWRSSRASRSAVMMTISFGQVLQANAWWDQGHMVTGMVAKMNLLEPEKFNAVLSCKDGTDPGNDNFTDIVPSSTWMDHVKCRSDEAHLPYCQGLAKKAGAVVFFATHLAKKTYDPHHLGNNLPLSGRVSLSPDFMDRDFPNGVSALDDISLAIRGKAESSWSLAFQLRAALHIWGDLHQPLHTGDLYNSGAFRRGDKGGNDVKLKGPARRVNEDNLHALWDSVGGNMPNSFPMDTQETARTLMQEYPPSYFIQRGKLASNWDSAGGNFGIRDVSRFAIDFVKDTNSHLPFVYQEYLASSVYPPVNPRADEEKYSPSEAYVQEVQRRGRQQVALGGYRLASWLNYHAEFMPEKPCKEVSRLGDNLNMALSSMFGLTIGVVAGCVVFVKRV